MAAPLGRLKRRPDFLRVARSGRKWVTPGLILQVARSGATVESKAGRDGPPATEAIRVGFTVSRKVGNAVARNRVRRRLKAAAAEVLPLAAEPGCDYVIIGRGGTLDRRWPALKQDLEAALRGLARRRGSDRRPRRDTGRDMGRRKVREEESGRRR